MNKFKKSLLVILFSIGLASTAVTIPATQNTQTDAEVIEQSIQYLSVNPIDVVNKPNFYLNKNIKIVAKFDKFVTLGLDYEPAYKSSENYISFLIQRPDITDHNIPLSEMKIFIKRKEAEKFIELNSGDEIEIQGKVFSSALKDAWVEVDTLKILKTVENKSKTTTK
ncbi:MAG: hypothetical protein R3Y28_05110 [Candidatus Gastranaerophilales bacterium]